MNMCRRQYLARMPKVLSLGSSLSNSHSSRSSRLMQKLSIGQPMVQRPQEGCMSLGHGATTTRTITYQTPKLRHGNNALLSQSHAYPLCSEYNIHQSRQFFHTTPNPRKSSSSSSSFSSTSGGRSSRNDQTSDPVREHLQSMKLSASVEPIPYHRDIPSAPIPDLIPGHTRDERKVTIVGCGQVGMAIAYAILNQKMARTIALVDRNEEKLLGEAKDLHQGSAFHDNVRIVADSNYAVSADSHLVIVTAGVAQKAGESRLSLVERNTKIMQAIIPEILAHSPHASICVVSNPCDIMTAVAAKTAGPSIPAGRIFGSGTCLDSSRLQSLLAQKLDLDTQSLSGYVVGEHGDSSVALWSSVRVGGIPMLREGEEPSPVHHQMHQAVVNSAYDVIQRKGYTNWAVGLTGAFIGQAVLNDQRKIMTVSTCVRGLYGIEEDVFLSMPCSIGAHGVRRVVNIPMRKDEIAKFQQAAQAIWKVQQGIWH